MSDTATVTAPVGNSETTDCSNVAATAVASLPVATA